MNICGIMTSPHVNEPDARHDGERLAALARVSLEHGPADLGNLWQRRRADRAGNQRAQQILPNVYGNGSPTKYLNINAFLTATTAPQGVYATTRPFTISGPERMEHRSVAFPELQGPRARYTDIPGRGIQYDQQRHVRGPDLRAQ